MVNKSNILKRFQEKIDIMRKRIKMKLFGVFLVLSGLAVIVYSLLSSASSGFWNMYIGFLMVVSGLGFLGVNVGSYPL